MRPLLLKSYDLLITWPTCGHIISWKNYISWFLNSGGWWLQGGGPECKRLSLMFNRFIKVFFQNLSFAFFTTMALSVFIFTVDTTEKKTVRIKNYGECTLFLKNVFLIFLEDTIRKYKELASNFHSSS